MSMTRRDFLIGGASAFGALGAFGGCRFLRAPHGFRSGGTPRLRFGVVSDIHILRVGADEEVSANGNNLSFRHTLEWFREQGVDAVVIAGDMADKGMDENLMAVSEAWYAVFPGDRYPDGRPVEKVFVTGNHDWIGHSYRGDAQKKYPDEAERAKHIIQNDMAGWWERAFHEPYEPIYSKVVNGYTFIGAHWDMGGFGKEAGREVYAFGRIGEFLEKNGRGIDPSLPFFYVQHPHPKDTCYGPWAWGHDKGMATKALSAWPNAIAFSGHSHYPLTDERSVWQGEFTSVGTSSLRYMSAPFEEFPAGYENTGGVTKGDGWKTQAGKMMGEISGKDCRQGMLWSVYDDCIVVRRRDFLFDLDLGEDWVLPLPSAEPRPFSFAERARLFRAPEFPEGAAATVEAVKAKNRGGKAKKGKERIASVEKSAVKVSVPAAVPDTRARLFSLEFAAETPDGKNTAKRILAEGFNHSPEHKKASGAQSCVFALDELGKGDVRFTVTPLNCFGARGRPLVAVYRA